MKASELTDLRTARKRAGLSQSQLGKLVGMDQNKISNMENAVRPISKRVSQKFAQHLDADSTELVIANRLAAMEKGAQDEDPCAVLTAAKGVVEIVGDGHLTPEGDDFLDGIVDAASKFAEKSGGAILLGTDKGLEL